MAHELPVLAGIPVAVQFNTRPCHWVERVDRNVSVPVAKGKYEHPVRLVEVPEPLEKSVQYDAWSVRNAFLGIRDEKGLISFLNSTGYFTHRIKGQWDVSRFKQWQEIVRQFHKRHPATWNKWLTTLGHDYRQHLVVLVFQQQFKISFRWKGTAHYAILVAEDTLSAILLTVVVDHLRGAKHGFCARIDCRKPFEYKTKHGRKYCSQYCAHLESVRRLRAKRRANSDAEEE